MGYIICMCVQYIVGVAGSKIYIYNFLSKPTPLCWRWIVKHLLPISFHEKNESLYNHFQQIFCNFHATVQGIAKRRWWDSRLLESWPETTTTPPHLLFFTTWFLTFIFFALSFFMQFHNKNDSGVDLKCNLILWPLCSK